MQDTVYLTRFSANSEYTSITFSETTQSLSNGLRGVSIGRVLQKSHRGFSRLVCDLPPALASTVAAL